MEIYSITAHEEYAHTLVIKGHTGHQGVLFISQVNLPIFTNPGELVVYPDAKSTVSSLDMVFLADMRKIQVADVVVMIKTYEKFAVSNRDISWHLGSLLMSG
jgi:hypothetical protein